MAHNLYFFAYFNFVVNLICLVRFESAKLIYEKVSKETKVKFSTTVNLLNRKVAKEAF